MSSELSGAPKQIWPSTDSLDALIAGPDNHTVLFENEPVRVLTHCWQSALFILTWNDLVRRDYPGNVMLDTRQALEVPKLNTPAWLEPLPPHSVENVGHAEINSVLVEIKAAP